MPDCKTMSELVSKALEDKPPVFTRMMMAIHLLMCRRCNDANQQMQTIHDAAAGYDDFCNTADADHSLPEERVREIKELINCPPTTTASSKQPPTP